MSQRTEYFRNYRLKNRERLDAQLREWQADNPERRAYSNQKAHAKSRGIEFLFTFEEWLDWWGDDFEQRGKDGLMMCRYNDEGAYEPSNVYKGTALDNSKDRWEKTHATTNRC